MGGSEQLVSLAGGLVGVGLALAAAFPFQGVPPQGVSGRAAPAQLEVRVLGDAELQLDPVGKALPPTAFPAPGTRGGPTVSVTARNTSPVPLRLSIRLTGLSASLDDAVTVRGSAAGAVLVDGPLGRAASWSKAAGLLPSGATTTLRLRFKLKPRLSPDAYNGRLDIRQLEFRGEGITSAPSPTTPGSTTPAQTPVPATTPAPATSPATSPATAPSGAGN